MPAQPLMLMDQASVTLRMPSTEDAASTRATSTMASAPTCYFQVAGALLLPVILSEGKRC